LERYLCAKFLIVNIINKTNYFMNVKIILKSILILLLFFSLGCQDDSELQKEISSKIPEANQVSFGRVGNHEYWYFFRGESSTNIRYAYSDDGNTWGGNVAFNNGAKSSTGVGAAYFNGKFIVVYKGASSNNIFYSYSYDGINWQGNIQIPVIATDNRPTLVIWKSKLWVFYGGVNNDDVWYISSSDGTNWSSQTRVEVGSLAATASTPVEAIVSPSGELEIFYSHSGDGNSIKKRFATSENNGYISFSAFSYLYGCDEIPITTNAGVSAAYLGNQLYIAYKSFDNNRLNIIKEDGCGAFFNSVYWTNSNTSDQPSLKSKNGKLTVIYRSESASPIRYSYSTDGQAWSGNVYAAGDTKYGGPSFLVE